MLSLLVSSKELFLNLNSLLFVTALATASPMQRWMHFSAAALTLTSSFVLAPPHPPSRLLSATTLLSLGPFVSMLSVSSNQTDFQRHFFFHCTDWILARPLLSSNWSWRIVWKFYFITQPIFSLQWGSISARWRYWSWLMACWVIH